MRVLIADDEPLAARRLVRETQRHADVEIIGPFSTGAEVRQGILEHRPDLALLDIEMPGGNGFDAIDGLSPDDLPMVIFTTAYKSYAIKAFRAGAIDYLLKPIDSKALEASIRKARLRLQERQSDLRRQELDQLYAKAESGESVVGDMPFKQAIWVKLAKQNIRVAVDRIGALEAVRDYVLIHTSERSYLKRAKISHLANQLDPKHFVRVHRSYVVNLAFVHAFETLKSGTRLITLQSGQQVPIGRKYAQAVADRRDLS